MAVPKKRMSNSRTAKRRANWDILTRPSVGTCPNCQSPLRPHRVCAACGQYKGRQVIASIVPDEPVATPEE